jgi:hypothetical protein
MVTILFAIISIFAFHLRSRTALELKLVAIEHQLAVPARRYSMDAEITSRDLDRCRFRKLDSSVSMV